MNKKDKQLVRQIETEDLRNPENVVVGFKSNVRQYKDVKIGDESWGKCASEEAHHKLSLRPIVTQDLRKPEDVVIGFKDNIRHYKDVKIGDDTWGEFAA